ncbi:MAG: hypothetical protein IMF10_00895 [Proteobacteria bacterium]|nr:hypothetical protein [Pseudomonadota bacterium]
MLFVDDGEMITDVGTEMLKRGCDGFIQKPFNLKDLSQKMREILDKKRHKGT